MAYLLERDGMNGKSGKGFVTVEGKNVELFGLKKFEAVEEYQKTDFPVVGTKTIQQKITGVKHNGSMSVYYGTPTFVQIAHDFQRTGRMPEITLQVTNSDPATSVGTQTIAYYNVVLDKLPLSVLDDSADFLEEEITFTYGRFEVLSRFVERPDVLGS